MTTAPKPAAAASRAGMKKELPEQFKSYKHVWVFIEYEHGQIHPVSLELLGEGRKLADKLGVELAGVLLGGERAALQAAAAESLGTWRRPGLSLRRSDSGALPQRTVHQGDDRSGQHLPAGDSAAGCDRARAATWPVRWPRRC